MLSLWLFFVKQMRDRIKDFNDHHGLKGKAGRKYTGREEL
jgi:hypothetical protein